MKKLCLVVLLLVAPAIVDAQTITCSIAGLTPGQQAVVTRMLARVNADRAAQTPPLSPFANVNEYCAFAAQANIIETIRAQQSVDAAKVGAAAVANGDNTALPAHCTAAGLSAGCSRNQVACFVLTGNTACN